VALAIPALKRGANSVSWQIGHDEPRYQGLVFSFPFEISTITRCSCRDRNRAGPQFLAIPSDRHLVRSWWHNQFLVPNNVVIELIHMAYEVQGLLAVQKNGGGCCPMELPASIWMRPRGPGTGSPTGSSFMSTGTVCPNRARRLARQTCTRSWPQAHGGCRHRA
jgi:hypothetical protein